MIFLQVILMGFVVGGIQILQVFVFLLLIGRLRETIMLILVLICCYFNIMFCPFL